MPRSRKPAISKAYHHGNVKVLAVSELKRLLSDAHTRDFTLPQLASALGISHAALYRHFDGKAGLLASLALEGYQRFGATLDAAVSKRSGRELLRATAVAYCAFAREEPALFRAMFHPLLRGKSKFPELETEAARSFRSLGTIVQQLGAGSQTQPALVAAAIWSCLHGAAALESDAWLPGRTGLTNADLRHVLPETLADVLFNSFGQSAQTTP